MATTIHKEKTGMTDQEIWNDDTPITDIDIDIEVPSWIEQDISPQDVAAIVQGGICPP